MALPFLTAEWRDLVLLNWEIRPELLSAYIPQGTELDQWNGRTFVSLVGFRFLKTRVIRIPVPFHVNFEEVNLRLYVTRSHRGERRRGVAFVKEIVPRTCIALVARRMYNENYVAAPMSHRIERRDQQISVRYDWTLQGKTYWVTARGDRDFRDLLPDSEEEFIVEHYWGYARQTDGGTVEYQVRHPRWQIAVANEVAFSGDSVALYGQELGKILLSPPSSAFLANGSKVEVGFGQRL